MFIDVLRSDSKKIIHLWIQYISKQNPLFMKLEKIILSPHTCQNYYYQKDKK